MSTARAIVGLALAAGGALGVAACGDDAPAADAGGPDVVTCFLGDPTQPPELQLIVRSAEGTILPAMLDGAFPIIEAPQGGKFFVFGARARNVTCHLRQLTGSVTDLCTNRPTNDGRPIDLVPDTDGWGTVAQPLDVTGWANVPACPGEWTVRDVRNVPYKFTVRIEDDDGRTATVSEQMIPYCADEDAALRAQCDCRCRADYVLGETCTSLADAGPPVACPP